MLGKCSQDLPICLLPGEAEPSLVPKTLVPLGMASFGKSGQERGVRGGPSGFRISTDTDFIKASL